MISQLTKHTLDIFICKKQLKFDSKIYLIKDGYPPRYSLEVFSKVMEQVENFAENNH